MISLEIGSYYKYYVIISLDKNDRKEVNYFMSNTYKNVEELRGHWSKDDIERKQQAKDSLFDYRQLESSAPAWLSQLAKDEWQRITELVKNEIPLSELDVACLASYCQAYATVQDCQAHIDDEGLVIETTKGNVKTNPYTTVQTNALKDLRMLATQLGLSVYSRMRIEVSGGKVEDNDPFSKVMNG